MQAAASDRRQARTIARETRAWKCLSRRSAALSPSRSRPGRRTQACARVVGEIPVTPLTGREGILVVPLLLSSLSERNLKITTFFSPPKWQTGAMACLRRRSIRWRWSFACVPLISCSPTEPFFSFFSSPHPLVRPSPSTGRPQVPTRQEDRQRQLWRCVAQSPPRALGPARRGSSAPALPGCESIATERLHSPTKSTFVRTAPPRPRPTPRPADIYLGTNVTTGEEVAMKLESTKSKHPQLVYEAKLYKILQGAVGE